MRALRRFGVTIFGLVISIIGVSAMTLAPAEAATGTVIANPSVVIRTGPTTSYQVIGSIPYRTSVTITCTTRGQSMTGPYGATTLWDKVSYNGKVGYVTDAYIYTGSASAVAPACSTSPTSTKGQRVASYAKSMVGRTGWNGWCEKWVEHVWGTTGRYPSAIAHYNAVRAQVRTTGTPPAGAVAFYAAASINGYYGHVMISLGNGQYVTTASTIRVVNQAWPGARYLGWYVPNWPGR